MKIKLRKPRPFLKHQQEAFDNYCTQRRHLAIFHEMRLGKTLLVIRWVVSRPTKPLRILVLTPIKSIGGWERELVAEGETFLSEYGVNRRYRVLDSFILHDAPLRRRVWFLANPEILLNSSIHFLPWDVVIAGECVAPSTLVSTPGGLKRIDSLSVGDSVLCASGVSKINRIWRRRVRNLYRIVTSEGKVMCSKTHLFHTKDKGWVPAYALQKNDRLTSDKELQALFRRVPVRHCKGSKGTRVLLSKLRSHISKLRSCIYRIHEAKSVRQSRCEKEVVRRSKKTGSGNDCRSTDCERKACKQITSARGTCKAVENTKGYGSQTSNTRWLWTRTYEATANAAGQTWAWLASRILCQTWLRNRRVSFTLQAGSCSASKKMGNRSGWLRAHELRKERKRYEEGSIPRDIRVESVEVVEQGDPDGFDCFNRKGECFLWDIEVDNDHTFFANGLLVHNCTWLRNPKAKRTKAALAGFRNAKHRVIESGLPNPEGDHDLVCEYLFLHGEFMGEKSFWSWRAKNMVHSGYDWIVPRSKHIEVKQYLHQTASVLSAKDAGMGCKTVREIRDIPAPAAFKKAYASLKKDFALQVGDELFETKWVVTLETWLARIDGGFSPDGKTLISDHKLVELCDLVNGELKNKQLVVGFRFNSEIEEAAKWLADRNVSSRIMWGRNTPEKNQQAERDFHGNRFRALLVQTALGRGLMGTDLSCCSTIVQYSMWWSNEIANQFEKRIDHPSKDEPGLIVYLSTKGTIGEKIVEGIKAKKLDSKMLLTNFRKEMGL